MGSSKKKKEKSRNRSPKEERSSRKRRHRDEDEEGQIDDSPQKAGSSREKRKRKNEEEPIEEMAEEPEASGGGAEESLSIEETNKLRIKLGLKPLEDDKPTVKEIEGDDGKMMELVKVDGSEFVHKPAENWGKKKEAESIREKLQALREKRNLDEKLGKVKLLGEADDDDSAASWVRKTKQLEEEKRLAELRAKMLEEMDKDYEAKESHQDASKKKPTKKAMAAGTGGYGTKDLAGMTVQHSKETIMHSKETILVLEDKDVLDESEDVLVNPTISEQEKWKKNAELRKKKPGYNPYDEEVDEFGMPKRQMLSKYDEEIEGEKKDSFQLSATGDADMRAERERLEMLAKLREGAESLESQPYRLANEYLTNEEMSKFKKPKKRVKKLRKRGTDLKADDLLLNANTTDEDFGSRQRGRGRHKADYERNDAKMEVTKQDEDEEDRDDSFDPLPPMNDDDLNFALSDDEAEQELQAALARARHLQQLEAKKAEKVQVVDVLPKSEPMDEDEDNNERVDVGGGKIVMDSISEYCRGLGDIPTYGLAGNREDVNEDDLIDANQFGQASTSRMVEEEPEEEDDDKSERGGWFERDINDTNRMRSSDSSSSDEELEREPILGEEPDMNNMGVAGALNLAVQKGYLKKDDGDRGSGNRLTHLKAQRFTIMDKNFHDIDDKYAKKLERMGGGGGPIVEFKEKGEYKPNVKLEYADDKGRLMDQKDAFRYLSWKFHGKAPGKRKVEKRTKKLKEKELFNEMSSTDTPLGTLSKQIEKQRQMQTPYIMLSGTGSKDGTAIKKD